jgi:predicted PurR-regulated permease PerM
VAWRIRAASEILSVVLLSLFFAFVYLPLPKWLIRRFHLRKGAAISLGVAFLALLHLILSVGLFDTGFRMRERLPIYEEHLACLYHQLVVFLSAHGVQSSA